MTEAPTADSATIVTNEDQPSLDSPTKKSSSSAPKWEIAARERMKAAIKKFNKPLNDLVARDANEGDTRLLVTDMLCEGFGFDKYSELTTEYRVKVDLLGEDTVTQKANQLYYLTKESLKRRQMDVLWQAKRATSPKSLAKILCSDNVVLAIRKELKGTTGQAVTDASVIKLLRETVLKPDCLGTR